VSRLVAVAFGALVVATFGAFFVAQRLKNAPSVVQRFRLTPLFSPNHDGRLDHAFVNFKLKRDDVVTVAVVDAAGDEVRVLADARRIHAYRPTRFAWDGRTDAGARAPDGNYRIRLTLLREGRSVVVPRRVRLDVTPPRPRVVSIGPFRASGPEILPEPDDAQATVHLLVPGRRPVVRLYKTSPGATRLVLAQPLPDGVTTWRWDGRSDGRPVSPGTYLVAIETRDKAGNRGFSPALDRRGLPIVPYGARLPGRGGIAVRYLGVLPPDVPTAVGQQADFAVDARQRPWTWSVRRVGSRKILAGGRKTTPRLRLHAPGPLSGVYLLQVRTATHATTVPFPVQAQEHSPVLVVLPVMTWQGRNPIDDDGDGIPNLLDRGVGVKLDRVYAGDGLPQGFAERDAPLLSWLDHGHHRYDVTTDVALATGKGPPLEGHKGVILPSDVRWLPRGLQQRLRRFVRRGGTLASFGVDSLSRQVTLAGGGQQLVDPTPPATTDLFGARLRPLTTLPAPTNVVESDDGVQFFAGTTGAFGPFSVVQEADSLGAGVDVVARAVTENPQTGRPVIAATRVGKGLVLRFPLPELPARLATPDPQVKGLLDRTWTLLSR
jgi:flagellar hook assembly protein FlgD